ncbi:hypothetical protein [Ramlibacter sp. WS9]|uniref:hypothetical protein n=1 Tax=Ramlibacter sp. WS9 TaxID=1882741 RepID=UPI0011448ACC|nr:hypothetical protein [Ramlibacter sp. WS9]ROZ74998.1 hypothetical protein EEB15_16615 [Ramlibacter sp. WS9]
MMLTDNDRTVFAALADIVIPAWENKPAASTVGVQDQLLDKVMKARPDLTDGIMRAIAFCRDRGASEAINALYRDDRVAFDAFTLAATGAYYMSDTVRLVIGYPGQESPPYDAHETPEYLLDGTLERVARRGPIYRPTPR